MVHWVVGSIPMEDTWAISRSSPSVGWCIWKISCCYWERVAHIAAIARFLVLWVVLYHIIEDVLSASLNKTFPSIFPFSLPLTPPHTHTPPPPPLPTSPKYLNVFSFFSLKQTNIKQIKNTLKTQGLFFCFLRQFWNNNSKLKPKSVSRPTGSGVTTSVSNQTPHRPYRRSCRLHRYLSSANCAVRERGNTRNRDKWRKQSEGGASSNVPLWYLKIKLF